MYTIEDYKKYGSRICKYLLKENITGNKQKITFSDEELEEFIKKLALDYSKLKDLELGITAFLNKNDLAVCSVKEYCTYEDGADKDDLISCLDTERLGSIIIEKEKDNYITLSTGKVIWYCLSKTIEEPQEDIMRIIKDQNYKPEGDT